MNTIHGLGLPLIPFRYAQACRFFIGGNEMHHILSAAVLLIAGIFLVAKGGDRFVDSASWIARAAGIPAFIIGATIVSIATTFPEITVSVMAAMGILSGQWWIRFIQCSFADLVSNQLE